MTDKQHPDDQALSNLYQQRKARHQAPSRQRRTVLSHNEKGPSWQAWGNRLTGFAVAASTVLLVSLVAFQQWRLNAPQPNFEFANIEIAQVHSLAAQPSPSLSQEITQKLASHYAAYLAKQREYASWEYKGAKLKKDQNGWELATCDRQLVKVSEDLINELKNLHYIEQSLSRGDDVLIAFANDGIILGISAAPKSASMCGSEQLTGRV